MTIYLLKKKKKDKAGICRVHVCMQKSFTHNEHSIIPLDCLARTCEFYEAGI